MNIFKILLSLTLFMAMNANAVDRMGIYISDVQNTDYGSGFIEYDKAAYDAQVDEWKAAWELCFAEENAENCADLWAAIIVDIPVLNAELTIGGETFTTEDFEAFSLGYSVYQDLQEIRFSWEELTISSGENTFYWRQTSGPMFLLTEELTYSTPEEDYSCRYPDGPCMREVFIYESFTYDWHAGEWSECTGDCGVGNGIKTRVVYCERSNETEAPEYLCKEPKPAETEACTVCVVDPEPCPVFGHEPDFPVMPSASTGNVVDMQCVKAGDMAYDAKLIHTNDSYKINALRVARNCTAYSSEYSPETNELYIYDLVSGDKRYIASFNLNNKSSFDLMYMINKDAL